jgi:hypothetical protein
VVVELEAVDDPRAVVEAEDVVGEEVTVTVAHPAIGNPPVEQRRPPFGVSPGERDDPVQGLRVERGAQPAHLLVVCLPAGQDGPRCPVRGDLGRRLRTGMELGDGPGDATELLPHAVPLPDRTGEACGVGEAPHHDQMVAGLAVDAEDRGHPR